MSHSFATLGVRGFLWLHLHRAEINNWPAGWCRTAVLCVYLLFLCATHCHPIYCSIFSYVPSNDLLYLNETRPIPINGFPLARTSLLESSGGGNAPPMRHYTYFEYHSCVSNFDLRGPLFSETTPFFAKVRSSDSPLYLVSRIVARVPLTPIFDLHTTFIFFLTY